MTPVEEYQPKLTESSDDIPLQMDNASSKERWAKGLNPNKQLSMKQKKLQEEAARAFSNSSGVSWNEFTQNTTFHGIKYIFDPSPRAYKTRRVMWVLCVIASVLFFVIQVALRVGVYFEYQTNVDVEKVYTTTVPFPAVTICNQNNFRLTVTAKKGLYHYIDNIFGGSDNETLKDITHYTNDDLDTVDFVVETSHQLEDFMDSCTWKGKHCNMSSDWIMTMTDMGVCYTFNSGPDGPHGQAALEVTESGAALGLSLILNLEQYEYMMGPQNDAGIKILLHDQSEFPMIKDLGFAVAPGTHTLVGVNRFVVESMEQPYGLCDALRNDSMSDCRISCYTREVVSRCGCRDIYMKNETEAAVCNMSSAFGCVRDAIEDLQKEENNCSCSVPCIRVNYEPALSYAQLSRFSIDRLVLKDPVRKQAVKDQYELSRETMQRTDLDILAADNEILSDIQTKIQALTDVVDSAVLDLATGELDTWITSLTSAVTDDYEYLEEQAKVVMEEIKNIENNFEQYSRCIPDLVNFVEKFEPTIPDSGDVERQLKECLNINCDEQYHGGDGDPGPGGPDGPRGDPKLDEVPDTCMELADIMDSILWLPNKYSTGLAVLYADTTADPTTVEQHQWCMNTLNIIQDESFNNATLQLTSLMRSMFAYPNQTGLVGVAEQLVLVMTNTSVNTYKDIHEQASWKCTWMGKTIPQDTRDLLHDLEEVQKRMPGFKSSYNEFKEAVSSISDVLTDNLAVAINAVDAYRAGNITKLKLARVLHSHLVETGIEDLLNFEMSLDNLNKKLMEKLMNIDIHLHGNFEYLFDLDVPLLNGERIANLSLIQFGRNISNDIEVLYTNMSQDYAGRMDSIMTMITGTFEQPITQMNDDLVEAIVAGGNVLMHYAEELVDYEQEMKMKQDFFMQNFLQVDIFYRELNTEHIVQRPSFSAPSLLGEVGGFLGLLLGASVLTMCELLDYIVMMCMARCHKKQQTAPS